MEESEILNNSPDVDETKTIISHQSNDTTNIFQNSNDLDVEMRNDSRSKSSKYKKEVISELPKAAAKIVENTLIASFENLDKCEEVKFPLRMLKGPCLPETENLSFFPVANIVWPSVAEFTPKKGEEIITFYIKNCWKYSKHWSFVVLLRQMPKTENIQFCIYDAIWSVPTRQSPIPAATATVYFIISYYKNKPKTEIVNVEYNVESSQIKHKPGQSRFDELWLQSIIEMKMSIIRDLNLEEE